MIPISRFLLATAFLALAGRPSSGAPGGLDTTFGGGDGLVVAFINKGAAYAATVVQPDGRILAAGGSINASGTDSDLLLARYTAAGALDTTFGGGDGFVTASLGAGSEQAEAIALQPDGRIVVAGWMKVGNANHFLIARFTAAGVLDASFGGGDGFVTTTIKQKSAAQDVAVQADGRIVACGSCYNGADNDAVLARYTASGVPDATFGGGDGVVDTMVGGFDSYVGLALQPDGKILAVGESTNPNSGKTSFYLGRYQVSGTLDGNFGENGLTTVPVGLGVDMGCAVRLQPDGRILVAGTTGNGLDKDFALVRLYADGELDPTFGGGGKAVAPMGTSNDTATAMVLQADGRIVVGGYVDNGMNADFGLARFTASGALDPVFGGQGKVVMPVGADDDAIQSLALQADGRIVATGSLSDGNGKIEAVVARFEAAASAATPALQPFVIARKKWVTSQPTLTLKGSATHATQVSVRIGGKTVVARGAASWSAKVKLKPGKNRITVTATGPGGSSVPAQITVIRNASANTRTP